MEGLELYREENETLVDAHSHVIHLRHSYFHCRSALFEQSNKVTAHTVWLPHGTEQNSPLKAYHVMQTGTSPFARAGIIPEDTGERLEEQSEEEKAGGNFVKAHEGDSHEQRTRAFLLPSLLLFIQ